MTGQSYRRLIGALGALSFCFAVAAGTMLWTQSGPWDGGGAVSEAGRGFVRAASPHGLPALSVTDVAGQRHALSDFKGKVVLLNLWATWCPPCVAEMPALNRLQEALGSQEFAVVTVAEDRGGAAVVVPFLEKLGARALTVYVDADGAAAKLLGTAGLPTSILIDRDGRDMGRMLGGAAWDVAPMRTVIEEAIGHRG